MKERTILAIMLLQVLVTAASCQPLCSCLNGGHCSPSNICVCPSNFIGQFCEIGAHPLFQQTRQATLSSNFSYFYFQPNEIGYYRLTFEICMILNPSLLPSLFYIQTEKSNGVISPIYSRIDTAKLIIDAGGCLIFTTHQISILQKENQQYHKIVIGLKVLEEQDQHNYAKVYSIKIKDKSKEEGVSSLPQQFAQQRVTVRMKSDKYIQNAYYGNSIIFSTVVFLVMIFGAVVIHLRKRYRPRHNRVSQFQQFQIQRYRYHSHSRHNPERQQRRKKQETDCIQVFMPLTRYGQKGCFFVADSPTNFQEMLRSEQTECCSICLNDFVQAEEVRTTPCKHQYHRECIDSWCESKLSCPICRRPLDFKQEIRKIYLQFLRGEIIQ